jgi:putative colanic acid biosynthesis glycosyltransferase
VIIDGGSTDGFVEFIHDLKDQRPIITTVISEPDEGIYDAMNKGVKNARGKGVVFLNAGDEIHPNCNLEEILQDLLEILQQPKIMGLAYCAIMRFGRKEFSVQSRNVLQNSPRMPSIHQAMIYKRSVLLSVPFDTTFKICGDYDNFAKIMSNFGYFRPVERFFVIFYAGGLSSQAPLQLMRESFYISSSHFRLNLIDKLKVLARLLISLTFVQLMLFWERKYLD